MEVVYTASMSRTNIDIDDQLIRKARRLTGIETKKAIVDQALKQLVRNESFRGILRYDGSRVWRGDLKAMRRSRV